MSSDESDDLPQIVPNTSGTKRARMKKSQENKSNKKRNAPTAIAQKEMNKVYRPIECMKYMIVEIHPTLAKLWYAADISREVTAAGARVEMKQDIFNPSLVMWSRRLPQQFTTHGGQAELTPSVEQCSHALYISTVEDVAELVDTLSLATHVSSIKEMVGCKLTLVVFGVKDYFKKSNRKTNNSNRKIINQLDLEMAITDLLVSAECDLIKVDSPNELALHIVQFTKAIAQKPYKLAQRTAEDEVDFYMRGENKNCVAVDKFGNGVERLWQQMLAVLPMSSLETSRAVCAKYKTPRELFEAAISADITNDIANIGVARSAVPGSKVRRVGPEFAGKLHKLFTAEDGDSLLDLTRSRQQ